MSQKSIYKPSKPYQVQNLVHGFCVPTKVGEGEQLICAKCGVYWALEMGALLGGGFPANAPLFGAILVTFDGEVQCSRCKQVL